MNSRRLRDGCDRYGDDLPRRRNGPVGDGALAARGQGYALAFAPEGQVLVSAGADNAIRFWKPDGTILREIKAEAAVECLAFSPDGKILAAGYFDRSHSPVGCRLGRADSKARRGTRHSPIQLAFSPDGKVLASASEGHEVARFWETSTGKEISQDRGSRSQAQRHSHRRFFPRRETHRDAGGEGYLFLWDAATGKIVRELPTPPGHWVTLDGFFAGQPNGRLQRRALYRNTSGLVDVAETKSIKLMTPRDYHCVVIDTVAFSPDGKSLAWSSRDKTARLWNLAGGKEIATLKGHVGHVNAVAFSADGKTLATAARTRPSACGTPPRGRKRALGTGTGARCGPPLCLRMARPWRREARTTPCGCGRQPRASSSSSSKDTRQHFFDLPSPPTAEPWPPQVRTTRFGFGT